MNPEDPFKDLNDLLAAAEAREAAARAAVDAAEVLHEEASDEVMSLIWRIRGLEGEPALTEKDIRESEIDHLENDLAEAEEQFEELGSEIEGYRERLEAARAVRAGMPAEDLESAAHDLKWAEREHHIATILLERATRRAEDSAKSLELAQADVSEKS